MVSEFFEKMSPKKALIFGVVSGVVLLGIIAGVVAIVLAVRGDEANAQNINPSTVQNKQNNKATAVTPSEKPTVELFVMSYCPYGTQVQKAFLPVMKLLGSKADIKIKFVNYTMHGEKEGRENTRQYCIQKNYPDKYVDFLSCFLDKGGQKDDVPVVEKCMANLKIDKKAVDKCMTETTSQFKIAGTDYPVYAAENAQYGVQGSPTLVINGVQVSPSSRSPEAVKQLICSAFTTQPEECKQSLSTQAASAGFGLSSTGSSSDASCN